MRDALALGADDPAVARLTPQACLDDAEVDAEFHRLMDEDLNAGRLAALETFEKSVDNNRLDEGEALSWLRAVNDVRLLLGTRLDVGEDADERRVSPDDPRAPGFALYSMGARTARDLDPTASVDDEREIVEGVSVAPYDYFREPTDEEVEEYFRGIEERYR